MSHLQAPHLQRRPIHSTRPRHRWLQHGIQGFHFNSSRVLCCHHRTPPKQQQLRTQLTEPSKHAQWLSGSRDRQAATRASWPATPISLWLRTRSFSCGQCCRRRCSAISRAPSVSMWLPLRCRLSRSAKSGNASR
eukprot:UN1150